jgi:phage baseplate assembly protein W
VTDFIGAGWAFPLTVANGDFALAGGTAKLEQAMRLILTTYPGDRPMRPDFGSLLRDHVFEGVTLDNAARIAATVTEALGRWEPRVDVDEVVVEPDRGNPVLLYIDIRYTVKATNDPGNLVFPFYTMPGEE